MKPIYGNHVEKDVGTKAEHGLKMDGNSIMCVTED